MNLHLLRKEFSLEKLINAVNQPDMIYPDQDGLNIICADRTLLLNSRWNTVPETKGNRNVEQIKQVVPKYLVDEYLAARNSPSIIHYALFEKPWKHSMSMDLDLYSKFWKYAAKSYCFSELYKDIAPQISVAERAQILTSSLNQKIKPLKFNNDVHYCVDDYYVTKLSDIPVKLEIFKIDDDNNIEIEGCVALVDSREFKNIKFWFYDGKTKHFCTIFDRNNTRNSQFETLIGFSVKIPIPESDFNLKLWCSIYGVPVTKVRINFGRFFPINKNLKKQYFFFKGHILSFSNSQLFIKKAKKFTRFLFERDYKKELRKSNNKFFKKAALVRTIRSFFMFFKKKPIWLIKDNFINSDNGFAFYKYLINNHKKDIKIFYVVNKTDLNIKKIRELGGRIIYQQSKKYKFVALMADWFISSVTDNKFTDPFFPQNEAYRDIISIKKFLFLQHGVISQDLSREHNKYVYNPTGFLVSGKQEYDSLLNGNYYYSKDEVWLTGLPRFDYLYNDDKKIITIMFTWRKYLDNIVKRFSDVEEKFSQSEYCKYCYSLINSQKLNAVAKKYGYKIGIKLHPLFAKYSNLLISKNNDNVVILNEHAYSEVFAKSSLIVTDYSSAIYDFLYLKKPVIYSQFDRDSFFSGKHAYDKGYLDYEKDGYGEVEYCLDGTINRIIEYIKSGCKMKDVYKKRVENFFEYSDNENCERVYNEIIKRS